MVHKLSEKTEDSNVTSVSNDSDFSNNSLINNYIQQNRQILKLHKIYLKKKTKKIQNATIGSKKNT
jgi:hypothetical protein